MDYTTFTILTSILATKDNKYITAKLADVENQINLNEVEKQIISDIKQGIQLGQAPSVAFIKQKYSYADTSLIDITIEKEAIDSAIISLMASQSRTQLKKDLLKLGNAVNDLSPEELKVEVNSLLENKIISNNTEIPKNRLQIQESPYNLMHSNTEGMSIIDRRIEACTGKALPGTVVTILGFAGSYKSTFALQVAYENALAGKNILYLALESTAQALINRLVLNHIASTATSRADLIDGKWIRDNQLTIPLQELYNKKHNELVSKLNNRLIIWDEVDINCNTFLDMSDTLRKADTLFKNTTGSGLDGIVLDQLALLKFTAAGGKRYNSVTDVLNDWTSYFRKQSLNFIGTGRQIVVFMVSQINRESYLEASKPKKKGRYDITCASDANEIERASATMITLYKDLDTRNTLLVNIPKAREGFVPDNPLQLEVYGEYAHIGSLNIHGEGITAEDFSKDIVSLESLINS